VAWLVAAIQDEDPVLLESVVELSRRRRLFAPLALVVGAFAMLLEGVRLLLSNWRLTLVQILPAMWIWLAMYDLKAHVLHGKSFHALRGPILIPIGLAIVAITAASLFLDAAFAFAIADKLPPKVRTGFRGARDHLPPILISGGALGVLLAVSTTVVTRSGSPWFALSLGIVIALMMIAYVAVPSRLIGMRTTASRRDKLTASAIGGAVGAAVVAPPYLLGRIGILMLGSKVLLIPGIFVLALGLTLQAGATGAVRAVKLSSKLIAGRAAGESEGALPAKSMQLQAGEGKQEPAENEHDPDDHGERREPDFRPGENHDPGDDLER
jgi:UPF0716 family protein affecting phage T7 exclusion